MSWFIPQAGFLERLSNEEKMQLGQICPPRNFSKGHTVFRAGDSCGQLTVVLKGVLKLSRNTAQGKERIIHLAGPGDILGAEFLEDGAVHHADAVCVSDEVVTCPIDREQFLQVSKRLPQVALSLVGSLSAQLNHLQDQVESASASVAERLARSLLWLAHRFGEAEEEGWVRISATLRQEDLAAMTASTRVTVTQTMGVLRDMGLVEGGRGAYRVKERELAAALEDLRFQI